MIRTTLFTNLSHSGHMHFQHHYCEDKVYHPNLQENLVIVKFNYYYVLNKANRRSLLVSLAHQIEDSHILVFGPA